MEAVAVKNGVLAALAVWGSYVAHQLGGWDAGLKVLVAMMAADYLTGLLLAAVWKRSPKSDSGALDSKAGFKGLVKKGVVLLVVWIGTLLDDATGSDYIRMAVVVFFIGNEGISLLENLGLMGVPYPAFLRRMLEALRDEGNEGKKG